MNSVADSAWQTATDRLVFVFAIAGFGLLTVIDGARNPTLNLIFSAWFTSLLAILLVACPRLAGSMPAVSKITSAGLFGIVCIIWLQSRDVVVWSSADPVSTRQMLYLYLGYLSAFVLFSMSVRSIFRVSVVIVAVTIIAIAQTLFGLVNTMNETPMFGWAPTHYAMHRVTGTFVNRNFYAGLVAMASGFLVAWLLIRRGPRLPRRPEPGPAVWPGFAAPLIGVLFAVLVTGMMMSGSRSALVAFLTAIGLLVLAVALDENLRLRRSLILVMGIGGLAVFSISVVGRRFGAALFDASDRLTQWRATAEMLPGNLLAGYGAGAYETAFSTRQTGGLGPMTYNHAHNDYLQSAMELGLPGLGMMALVTVPVVWAGVSRSFSSRSITRKRLLLGALFAIVVMLLQALFDFPFQVPALTWQYLVILSLIATLSGMDLRRRNRGETS